MSGFGWRAIKPNECCLCGNSPERDRERLAAAITEAKTVSTTEKAQVGMNAVAIACLMGFVLGAGICYRRRSGGIIQ